VLGCCESRRAPELHRGNHATHTIATNAHVCERQLLGVGSKYSGKPRQRRAASLTGGRCDNRHTLSEIERKSRFALGLARPPRVPIAIHRVVRRILRGVDRRSGDAGFRDATCRKENHQDKRSEDFTGVHRRSPIREGRKGRGRGRLGLSLASCAIRPVSCGSPRTAGRFRPRCRS
jgi:hypothetical protein